MTQSCRKGDGLAFGVGGRTMPHNETPEMAALIRNLQTRFTTLIEAVTLADDDLYHPTVEEITDLLEQLTECVRHRTKVANAECGDWCPVVDVIADVDALLPPGDPLWDKVRTTHEQKATWYLTDTLPRIGYMVVSEKPCGAQPCGCHETAYYVAETTRYDPGSRTHSTTHIVHRCEGTFCYEALNRATSTPARCRFV
jgi:hypothetical protein